jgi:MFS family permease
VSTAAGGEEQSCGSEEENTSAHHARHFPHPEIRIAPAVVVTCTRPRLSCRAVLRESLRQRELLKRAPAFRSLFLARLGSGLGTYLAAIALQVDVFDRTHSGSWISALLIAEFLPVILIGLLLGPLLDRWPRRTMMVASDLANVVVFAALPFTSSATQIVALAFASGVANGFFRPLVYAGLPNLVADRDLESAGSLLQTIENVTTLIGPPLGGLLVAASSPHANYWINAATFLLSASFVVRIGRERLQTGRAASQGHWRDLVAGFSLVRRSAALSAVLVTWPIFNVASASVNVSEVVLAKHVLNGGDVGFGVLVGAAGLGLAVGSFVAGQVTGRIGLAATYAGSLTLMGLGTGAAALSPNVWVAAGCVVFSGAGNGAAVVCNFLLIARGAPDELRGRAVTVLMSVGSSCLFLGMIAAGRATDAVGARWVWGVAALILLVAAVVGLQRAGRVSEGPLEPPEALPISPAPIAGVGEAVESIESETSP